MLRISITESPRDVVTVNLEGSVQEATAALKPVDGVRSNVEALQAVAQSLGVTTKDNWKEALFQRKPVVEIG